jgi:hypothetical protein
MLRNLPRLLLCIFVSIFLPVVSTSVIGFAAETTDVPTCSNGDCPPPPACSNGDCPPPPTCSNGDCPEEPPIDCCCVGSNLPGSTTRVCCCRSVDLDTVNCRESEVLNTTNPEFHSTIAEVTMDGFRPEKCNVLLQKYCDPPVEEVCTRRYGKRICERVVKRVCTLLDQVCQYNFCGPDWFPYDEPTPDMAGCEWWDQIRECPQLEEQ